MNHPWFKRYKKKDGTISADLLRAYIEGDLPAGKLKEIKNLIETSKAVQTEYKRIHAILSALRNLPVCSPPKRVWTKIEEAIEHVKPAPVWFPWLYRYMNFARTAGVGVCIALLLFVSFSPFLWDPVYNVIEVKELNGFGAEAKSYLVQHDLTGELPLAQGSAIAFYKYVFTHGAF